MSVRWRSLGAGAVAVVVVAALALVPSMRARADVTQERVEISAPILPRTQVIYQPFPDTLAGEVTMAHDAALTFDWLLPQCAPLYPAIVLDPSGGANLSPEQLFINYAQVGDCSYEQYSAKPYWIPKLVDDVDICGTEMGTDWRLITEDDLSTLSESDFQLFVDSLGMPVPGAGSLAQFFVTDLIWVRAADGTIQAGTLAPGAPSPRVTPLGNQSGFSPTEHYEGSLALRCIRRTNLP